MIAQANHMMARTFPNLDKICPDKRATRAPPSENGNILEIPESYTHIRNMQMLTVLLHQ